MKFQFSLKDMPNDSLLLKNKEPTANFPFQLLFLQEKYRFLKVYSYLGISLIKCCVSSFEYLLFLGLKLIFHGR